MNLIAIQEQFDNHVREIKNGHRFDPSKCIPTEVREYLTEEGNGEDNTG
jgi:hypothetical protein